MAKAQKIAELLAEPHLNQLERRILLAAASGLTREDMVRTPEALLDTNTVERYRALLDRRLAGEPIAYLTGRREFYGRDFLVDARVLIPRPETELLVDLAREHLKDRQDVSVLDLGTGSGCLAITIKLEMPEAKVVALDNSSDALDVARHNASTLGAHVDFIRADLRSIEQSLALLGARHFGLVVANPPYIPASDRHLQEGDLRFEPKFALTDGADGFDLIDASIGLGRSILLEGAMLLIEHGHDQALAVRQKLARAGFTNVRSWTDLAGIERVTGAAWPGL